MNQTEINERTDLLCKMLQFQEGIYENALVELDDDLALKRPNDRTNHINWLLGHLLHCRVMLMNMIGKKTAYPFEGIYWSPIEDGKYRTIGEISDSFSQISKELISNLENLGIENLDRKKEPEQPTLQEIITFFIYHEAYHLGQIGYARKFIGMPALKSN